jgi:hypothetical protein
VTDQLEDLFAELRAETIPRIQPPGPAVAHRTVRRRRLVRSAAACVVVVAAVGVGAQMVRPAPAPRPAGTDPAVLAERQQRAAATITGDGTDHAYVVLDYRGMADGQTVASRPLLAATYILQMACSGPGRVTAVLHGATASDGQAIGLCDLGGDVSQSFLVPADTTVSVELRPADGAQDQAGVAVRLMMMADDATGLVNAAKDRLPPARGTTVAVSGSFLSTATSTVDDTIAPGDYRLEFACAGAGTVRITLHYRASGADTSEVASCGNGGRAVELPFARPAGESPTTVLAPDPAAAGQSAFAARVERDS